MATSAFKSTTKRSSIGGGAADDSSHSTSSRNSNSDSRKAATHRRSRSVSRFSHRLPGEVDFERTTAHEPESRGKFVNKVRGSAFPEISLDDLAIELFSSSDLGSRDRSSEVEVGTREERRGRSISRKDTRVGEKVGGGGAGIHKTGGIGSGRMASDASSRRRRSLSVARYQASDSETEGLFDKYAARASSKNLGGANDQKLLKPSASGQQRGLRRCASQKNMFKPYDDYSSYSSALTDDEARDAWYHSDGFEKIQRSRHKKAEDRSMHSVLRHSADKVRIRSKPPDLDERGDLRLNSNVLEAVSTRRRSYATELEQSEKRKQELLAEIILEEQRGKELQKIVGGLLPDTKEIACVKRPSRPRKRSNDRIRVSEELVEDADKIIEDFISSVEDTDISSFDGERSDTSSVFGVAATKPRDVLMQFGETESLRSATNARSDFLPMAPDGVVLPWLEWETGNDGSPLPCRDKTQVPATPKTVLQDALEETSMVRGHVHSAHSTSSRGSWSPGLVESFSVDSVDMSRTGDPDAHKCSQLMSNIRRRPRMDIEHYLKTPNNEEYLIERWKHKEQISSGGLLLCHNPFDSILI